MRNNIYLAIIDDDDDDLENVNLKKNETLFSICFKIEMISH